MADLLQAQGFGTVGKTIFTAQFNQDSDPCKAVVLVTPAAGLAATCALDRPRMQVMVRCRDSVLGWETAANIYDYLKMLGKLDLGTNLLVSCTAIQTPFPLGLDENKCWLFACNYQLELGA